LLVYEKETTFIKKSCRNDSVYRRKLDRKIKQ